MNRFVADYNARSANREMEVFMKKHVDEGVKKEKSNYRCREFPKWVRSDNKEIHMNFKRCIYLDLTTQYGCPELCTAFCKNDPVTLAAVNNFISKSMPTLLIN